MYYLAWLFAPGSYARSETYEFQISEEIFIKIIDEVKQEHQELKVPSYGYEDGRKNNLYSFYYQDKNQIIHTWARPKSETTTTFAFSAYKSGDDLGNWTNANKYFWWWKNSKAKKEFEVRILHKIEEKIKNAS
jgi:hypothetical protein